MLTQQPGLQCDKFYCAIRAPCIGKKEMHTDKSSHFPPQWIVSDGTIEVAVPT